MCVGRKPGIKSSNNCTITAPSAASVVVIATMATSKTSDDESVIKLYKGYTDYDEGSIVTDTIAGIVSAVLSLVFVVLVVCIIRAIYGRRLQSQGRGLDQPIVHTIAPWTMGAHLPAHRHALVSGSMSLGNTTTQSRQSHLNEPSSSGVSREALVDSSFTSLSQSANGFIHQKPSTSKWSMQVVFKDEVLQSSHPSSESGVSQATSTVPAVLYKKVESATDYHFGGEQKPQSGASLEKTVIPS